MSANADISTGLTVAFGTSSYAPEITGLSFSGGDRNVVDTSHMGTTAVGANEFGNRTYVAGDLSDPGEMTMELNFNPDDDPPIGGATETVTVTFDPSGGDGTGADWAGSAVVTNFEWNAPLDDKMTASCTVKYTTKITMTDGSV